MRRHPPCGLLLGLLPSLRNHGWWRRDACARRQGGAPALPCPPDPAAPAGTARTASEEIEDEREAAHRPRSVGPAPAARRGGGVCAQPRRRLGHAGQRPRKRKRCSSASMVLRMLPLPRALATGGMTPMPLPTDRLIGLAGRIAGRVAGVRPLARQLRRGGLRPWPEADRSLPRPDDAATRAAASAVPAADLRPVAASPSRDPPAAARARLCPRPAAAGRGTVDQYHLRFLGAGDCGPAGRAGGEGGHHAARGGSRLPLPFRPAEEAAALAQLELVAGGYLLSVATLEPRKNLATLIAAYAGLPEGLQARAPLVLVGQPGWGDLGLPAATGGADPPRPAALHRPCAAAAAGCPVSAARRCFSTLHLRGLRPARAGGPGSRRAGGHQRRHRDGGSRRPARPAPAGTG